MSKTKTARAAKQQLGQFFTPAKQAQVLVSSLELSATTAVLEPSAGNGAFVLPLIERFMNLHRGSVLERLSQVLQENVYAVEIDHAAYAEMIMEIERRWGKLPQHHHLVCGDYFVTDFEGPAGPSSLFGEPKKFDVVIGNPPFGGTIDVRIQDRMDGLYGERDGLKIKKETYSFFIVRAVESLKPGGRLRYICSDTFLTIPTMKGLREFLLNRGRVSVSELSGEFEETKQPMVVLDFELSGRTTEVEVCGRALARETINLTGNRSWQVTEEFAPLFAGKKLGDMMVASSGMTVGNNELFVRDIVDGTITETKAFRFWNEPITLRRELERARLGYISPARMAEIEEQEKGGAKRRNVEVVSRDVSQVIQLPHSDYAYYNKACSDILFAPPRWAIYWKDDGDAVKTYKKNGNWYLHGVGGMPYFKREGLSWQLISPSLNARYLPSGYILDSGAPCAFLRDGVDQDELWFVLGWCLTPLCTRILKDVLNHTRNIQSKDFERLPYPFWVSPEQKSLATKCVKACVQTATRQGREFKKTDYEVLEIAKCYEPPAMKKC